MMVKNLAMLVLAVAAWVSLSGSPQACAQSVGDAAGSPSESTPVQATPGTTNETSTAASQESGGGIGLPALNGRWLNLFSVSQVRLNGVGTASEARTNDMYTQAEASFSYEVLGRRTGYNLNYDVAGRRHNRLHSFDSITHSAGVGHFIRLSRRLAWTTSYNFRYTPEFYSEVLRAQNVREESSNAPPPVEVEPDETLPSEELVPFQVDRTTHFANSSLSYDMSRRASLRLRAAYGRNQYTGGLSGSRRYLLSVGIGRVVNEAITVRMDYEGSRLLEAGRSDRTQNHGTVFSLSRRLTPATVLTLSAGPQYSLHHGESLIQLSPLQQEVLGRAVLVLDENTSRFGWQGRAQFRYRRARRSFWLSYSRSVSLSHGFGSASTRDQYQFSFGQPLTRTMRVDISARYSRNRLFQIVEPIRRNEQFLRATITRRLGSFEVAAFGYYATIPRSSSSLSHNQFGVRLTYSYPRM